MYLHRFMGLNMFEYTYKFCLVLQTHRSLSINQQSQIDFPHFTPLKTTSNKKSDTSDAHTGSYDSRRTCRRNGGKVAICAVCILPATGSLQLRHWTGHNRNWSEVFNESFSAFWNPKTLEIQGHLIIYNHLHILSEIWKRTTLRGWERARKVKQWYLKMTLKLLSNMLLQHPIPLQKELC